MSECVVVCWTRALRAVRDKKLAINACARVVTKNAKIDHFASFLTYTHTQILKAMGGKSDQWKTTATFVLLCLFARCVGAVVC